MKRYKEIRYSVNGKYKVIGILFSDNARPITHIDILIGKKERIIYSYTNQKKLPKYVVAICVELQAHLILKK